MTENGDKRERFHFPLSTPPHFPVIPFSVQITLATYGTRGDVQPFVALGLGLQRAGHRVRVAAPAAFESFVTRYGLSFAPLAGDPQAISRALVDSAGRNPWRVYRELYRQAMPLAKGVYDSLAALCSETDVLVHSFLLMVGAHTLARQAGVRDVSAQLIPLFGPTGAFSSPMFPGLRSGAALNRLTHVFFERSFWWGNRVGYWQLRRRNPQLPPAIHWPFARDHHPATPLLYGFSRHVVPPPAEWQGRAHVTGYWFLDAEDDWQPPPALLRCLEAGPPPVCVGFSSVVTREAQRLAEITLAALRRTGRRGVILGGWAGWQLAAVPDTVCVLDAAPHGWLFPRVAMVIHHGGAGTTAAGLRAGVPSLITPFTTDQPFWAWRVQQLGVGPQPIPQANLTAENLAAAIDRALHDAEMQQRAARLGEKIRAEAGVAKAVAIIGKERI
jgi:sterol 3beta-glucosyltransferase